MNLPFAPRRASVFFAACAFALAASGAQAQSGAFPPAGDQLVAQRYILTAEEAFAQGRGDCALAVLLRANDFADASSDVSYLLALARIDQGHSRLLSLAAIESALATNKWMRYGEAQALELQAGLLVDLRRFSVALGALDARAAIASENAETTLLRLRALKGLAFDGPSIPRSYAADFRALATQAVNMSPRDPRPLRLLFEYALQVAGSPGPQDIALIELGLRRLPFLLDLDPDLAWLAAPFIGDLEEARRLLLAYRAGSIGPLPGFLPNPASIPLALNLGLLDDFHAVDELFAWGEAAEIDREIVNAVAGLLRGNAGRDALALGLHSFTGAIVGDENRDGIIESRAVFRNGFLQALYLDLDQDGVADWIVSFDTGLPSRGEFIALPDASSPPTTALRGEIVWDRYPFVQRVALGEETYFFAPGSFAYGPILFENIGAAETYQGLLVPARDPMSAGLTRHALAMAASFVERPSAEFPDGIERAYLRQGVPVLSEVRAQGVLVSVTEFEAGFPVVQRVDVLREGRLQTLRRFHPGSLALMSVSVDWNGDGEFELVEMYLEDGSIVHK
ncbi:MAG: hypothetical protein FWE09_01230 [Treponema sp.]|nr:hypothetical protein [Treponema sp.]